MSAEAKKRTTGGKGKSATNPTTYPEFPVGRVSNYRRVNGEKLCTYHGKYEPTSLFGTFKTGKKAGQLKKSCLAGSAIVNRGNQTDERIANRQQHNLVHNPVHNLVHNPVHNRSNLQIQRTAAHNMATKQVHRPSNSTPALFFVFEHV